MLRREERGRQTRRGGGGEGSVRGEAQAGSGRCRRAVNGEDTNDVTLTYSLVSGIKNVSLFYFLFTLLPQQSLI